MRKKSQYKKIIWTVQCENNAHEKKKNKMNFMFSNDDNGLDNNRDLKIFLEL